MFRMYFCIGVFVIVGLLTTTAKSEYATYECPTGWEDHTEYCYRFIQDPKDDRIGSKEGCRRNGAFVLSVNAEQEHTFISQKLDEYDIGQTRLDWWTSGRRESPENLTDFYWEGDGEEIETVIFWHNTSVPLQKDKQFIVYHFDGYKWGWSLAEGDEISPYICKIHKNDIYMIITEERGADYGLDEADPEQVKHGPKFIRQPLDTVFEPLEAEHIGKDLEWIECMADANPAPKYEWFKERGNKVFPISPSTDSRYTFINGRLVIDRPSTSWQDDGDYQCKALNEFGSILSEKITLSFGYLHDFPKAPRAPVEATSYQWVSIECNPPSHYPSVAYNWYKNDPSNFVRPDLKPYMFISLDGRLYFSEVTEDDAGLYYCIVTRPGVTASSGKESMPTELVVRSGSAAEYEPVFGEGFPLVFPADPIAGDTVRIECWASGSSQPVALEYFWERVETDGKGKVLRDLPLPVQSRLSDHNRLLTIPNMQLYDAGEYRCRCSRPYGQQNERIRRINLNAKPYFILPLKDQFVDIGSTLIWRCEVGGLPAPSYHWLKNGTDLEESIKPEDAERITLSNNVLTIRNLNEEKDDNMYQCAGSNSHGTVYSSAQLKVLSFAPTFKKYPLRPTHFASAGGNTTVFCRPEAAPQPVITWFKDGANLNPSTAEGARVRVINGNLFISPVEKSDKGVYRCHAQNSLGEASSTGNLTVLSSVSISIPPDQSGSPTIRVNRTRFLHCVASYSPKLDVTYTWYHGDMIIEFERIFRLGETRYQVWHDPNYKRGKGYNLGGIYIMDAQYEHAGRYTCQVQSPAGDRFERYADVNIIGPPSPPAGVIADGSTVTESSIVVTWKEAASNGRDILSYIIEAYNHWEGFWRIMETLPSNKISIDGATNSMMYNVTNLRPFSMYRIRLRAENMIGTSVPSDVTGNFTTESVKPDLIPEYVGGGGGKVGDLVITWKPLDPWEENAIKIGYYIYWKPAGEAEFGDELFTVHGSVGQYIMLVGQDNFYRQYDVAIQAFNSVGLGPRSDVVRIRSAMAMPTGMVTNVRAQPFNATACLVHWVPVEDSRESVKGRLGGYKMAYWEEWFGEDFENPWRVTLNGQMDQGLVIGLDPDRVYYFAIYVWNEAGNGPKSQWFIQRTLRNAPVNQPVEVQVHKKSDRAIHAYWRGVSTTQIEEPLQGYNVRIWREGEDIKVARDYDAAKETDLYIDDLSPNILYKLRVYGYSRGGMGTMSSPAIVFMLGSGNRLQISALTLSVALLFILLKHSL